MVRATSSFVLAGSLTAIMSAAGSARAEGATAAQCAGAAEKAQSLRDAAKLVEARAQLLVCMRDECPQVVVHDCVGWMREVEQNLPTVVFAARDPAGADVTDVAVRVDGVPTVQRLDGTAVAIDPGEHVFRFERAGAAPVDVHALVREGEKNRILGAQWTPGLALGAAADSTVTGPASAHGRHTAWPWIVGGVAVVAAGTAIAGIASGLTDRDRMTRTCGTTPAGCPEGQIDSARTRVWIGDVAAGVAVVAGAAAAWLFVSESTRVSVGVQAGAPRIAIEHRF
ncbi:MAG TPA: hypothetical protein VIY73_25915 [Polyangiaceae bacterium]